MSFNTLGLHPDLLRSTQDLGYTEATPIQGAAIPPALAGRDLLACAMTGSGKTAAFALPILQRLRDRRRGAVRALVLAPTRELAAQVQEDFAALGARAPVRAAAVYGGVGMGPQEDALRRGVDVIVATPGRLLDHIGRGTARFDELEVLVLDEADRMLDMGFLPDIKRVIAHLPRKPRQTLFFSATMPPPIATLARELLRDPVSIDIERRALPATGVAQAVYPVPQERKTALLLEVLKGQDVKSVLAFTRTKHRANRLADFLDRNGVSSARIHGNRSQAQRTQALEGFKAGRFKVLVATDIAARGIDIDALSHVVNFDVPGLPEDYIHRVGRTARAKATGDAITFAAPDEDPQLRDIERAIGKKLPRVTVPGFNYETRVAERFEIPIGERIAAIRKQKSEERARSKAKTSGRPAAAPAKSRPRGGRSSPAAAQSERTEPIKTTRPVGQSGHVTFTTIGGPSSGGANGAASGSWTRSPIRRRRGGR